MYDEDDCTVQVDVQVTEPNLNGIYRLDIPQESGHVAAPQKKP